MYRSEYLYRNIDLLVKDEDVFPICVPSYSRPNASLLKHVDKLPIVLFIRREQEDMYRIYKDKCKLVLMDDVSNIGETRHYIVNYANTQGWSNIFMLDDDIKSLWFNIPSVSDTSNKEFMRSFYTVNKMSEMFELKLFKMWIWMISLCDDRLSLSSPGQRSDYWNLNYRDEPIVYNRGTPIQCVHLNIENLVSKNINYQSTTIVGAEDYAIIYDIMKSGLYTTIFTDLAYRTPAVGSNSGGCNSTEVVDLVQRYEKFISLFYSNVLDSQDLDRISTKISKDGIKSIKFKWNKWRIKETRPWGI